MAFLANVHRGRVFMTKNRPCRCEMNNAAYELWVAELGKHDLHSSAMTSYVAEAA